MHAPARPITVALIALYRYQNFPIRILHALLERVEGVRPHTIFFQNFFTNAVKSPSAREAELLRGVVRDLNPSLIGFSVYSPFAAIAEQLTAILKQDVAAPIVWGGIHPTLLPEASLAHADIICSGEGEGALVDLVTAVRDGKDYRKIRNLWVRDRMGFNRNPMRPLLQDLDSLPFPAHGRDPFHFIENETVLRQDPTVAYPLLNILPARGCPFRCSFCVNSLLHPLYRDLGPYSRRRSVANVIEEIKTFLELPGNRTNTIEFHDENFGTDASWLAEFEDLYPREIGLPFKVQYNPTLVKADTIERLAAAGLRRVKFGIEAGTDRIRNHVFRRPGKNRDIVNLARQIARCNVKIRYDLIIDNPYDTPQTLEETLRLLMQLPKPLRFNLYSLQFFPEYPLTRRALADGHITEAEADLAHLQERMARNWAFVPRLLPLNRKQALQNIIWLYVYGRTTDKALRHAVFQSSPGSRLHLAMLNLKSLLLGKLHNLKRLFAKPTA
jgi:radical SAM superfamily enzyme YgiQ (UPF0313 family)